MPLSQSNIENIAKEFTIVAMQNRMITLHNMPSETAKNVMSFYHAVVASLTEKDK